MAYAEEPTAQSIQLFFMDMTTGICYLQVFNFSGACSSAG